MRNVFVMSMVLCFASAGFAATTSESKVIGILKLSPKVSETQAVEVADVFAKEPSAEMVYIRQTGPNTWGIGIHWKSDGSKESFKKTVDHLKATITEKLGKQSLEGVDLGSTVIWIKK